MSTKNVFIFCLGRELLEGSVLDRNGNFMAKSIDRLAFRVQSVQSLDEVQHEMVSAFRTAIEQLSRLMHVSLGLPGGEKRELLANREARQRELFEALEIPARTSTRLKDGAVVTKTDFEDCAKSA